jgi:CBS domain containing-hemolysin-like protein
MRARRCHVAVLIDGYGGTAGMITLRDLLEALVGRIEDGPPVTGDVPISDGRVESDGSMLLDGLLRVEEFAELARITLAEDELHEGIETLGGLIPAVLGRFPDVGEEVRIGGRRLRVESRTDCVSPRTATAAMTPPGCLPDRPASPGALSRQRVN